MKEFFNKVLKDALPKIVAAIVVAALALLVPPIRVMLFTPLEVPAWMLLLSLLAAGLGLAHLIREKIGPRHERLYREEEIDGIVWRWDYQNGAVSHLRGFCAKPGCDTELMLTEQEGSAESGVRSFRGTTIYCTACNSSFGITNAMNLPDHERRKIEKRIRDGSWKDVTAKKIE